MCDCVFVLVCAATEMSKLSVDGHQLMLTFTASCSNMEMIVKAVRPYYGSQWQNVSVVCVSRCADTTHTPTC